VWQEQLSACRASFVVPAILALFASGCAQFSSNRAPH
jgi:hypothetical protein